MAKQWRVRLHGDEVDGLQRLADGRLIVCEDGSCEVKFATVHAPTLPEAIEAAKVYNQGSWLVYDVYADVEAVA